MWGEDFRLGIVDERRAFAAAVIARNPHAAKRILGRSPIVAKKPAPKLPPVLLAKAPKPSGRSGRVPKYPWAKLAIGEWFDVPASTGLSRRSMGKQARQARGRHGYRYGVTMATDAAGCSVIRVRRVA